MAGAADDPELGVLHALPRFEEDVEALVGADQAEVEHDRSVGRWELRREWPFGELREMGEDADGDDVDAVGVGAHERRDLADHVLSRFEKDEAAEVERMTPRAADAAEMFITSGIEAVMNAFNGGDPATTE